MSVGSKLLATKTRLDQACNSRSGKFSIFSLDHHILKKSTFLRIYPVISVIRPTFLHLHNVRQNQTMPIHCRHCQSGIDLESALQTTPYSWPNLQAFWHVCEQCTKPNHIRIEEGLATVIEITGAPGPTWEYVEKQRYQNLSFRWDPEILHVWLDGRHYGIGSRK